MECSTQCSDKYPDCLHSSQDIVSQATFLCSVWRPLCWEWSDLELDWSPDITKTNRAYSSTIKQWLRSFSNLDQSERNAPRSQSNLRSDLLRSIWAKSDLAMPICAAGCRRSLFTIKRGRGLRRSAFDENKMTTPTMNNKSCAFFFTGLDRSRLTNQDWSRSI